MADIDTVLQGTCANFLTLLQARYALTTHTMTNLVIGIGIVCIFMAFSIPALFYYQYRKSKLWFFRLKRTTRGSFIVAHPINVFLFFHVIVACCVFSLSVMTALLNRGHERPLNYVVFFELFAWLVNTLGFLYITIGTFLAIPESAQVPGFVKVNSLLRRLLHPYVSNVLVLSFPIFLTAACLPNVVFAQNAFVRAISYYSRALRQMAFLASQDPEALIPTDVQALIIDSNSGIEAISHHSTIFFAVVCSSTLAMLPLAFSAIYSTLWVLRKQMLDEAQRVQCLRLEATHYREPHERTLPSALSIEIHTSTHVCVDAASEHETDQAEKMVAPQPAASPGEPSFPAIHIHGQERSAPWHYVPHLLNPPLATPKDTLTSTSMSPSEGTLLPEGEANKAIKSFSQAKYPLQSPPLPASGPPITIGPDVSQASHQDSACSLTARPLLTKEQSSRDAGRERLKYLRRCFYTITAFYGVVAIAVALHLGISLVLAFVISIEQLNRADSFARIIIAYECASACVATVSFALIGVKLSD